MNSLRALHERDTIRKQNKLARKQQARGGGQRGAEADDPASLDVTPFQRELLEDKNIQRVNKYRNKVFNSMFNKQKQ